MKKYFIIRNFRGTCLSVKMLKVYMIRERLGTPAPECYAKDSSPFIILCDVWSCTQKICVKRPIFKSGYCEQSAGMPFPCVPTLLHPYISDKFVL